MLDLLIGDDPVFLGVDLQHALGLQIDLVHTISVGYPEYPFRRYELHSRRGEIKVYRAQVVVVQRHTNSYIVGIPLDGLYAD